MEKFLKLVDGYLKTKESIARFPLEKTLFVTRCCGVKAKIKRGCAKDLYISSINQNFYKVMEDNGYNYATISDFYGLVYPQQVIDNYNLHPSELTEEQKIKLVDTVKSQLQGKYDRIIFYNTSPLMSVFYLRILRKTVPELYFMSKLSLLEKTVKRKLF